MAECELLVVVDANDPYPWTGRITDIKVCDIEDVMHILHQMKRLGISTIGVDSSSEIPSAFVLYDG